MIFIFSKQTWRYVHFCTSSEPYREALRVKSLLGSGWWLVTYQSMDLIGGLMYETTILDSGACKLADLQQLIKHNEDKTGEA